MNRVLFDFGFIQIYWYSVLIFVALLIGGTLALHEGKKWRISEDKMINMFFFLIPISIIGARLYYVAFNWSYYSQNLIEILEVWEGGLAIHGGIIAGFITLFAYCKMNKLPLWKLTDIAVPSIILAQAIGRWGNFFNSEVYGKVVEESFFKIYPAFIKKGMYIDRLYRTPLFLYECIWNLIGFIILIIFRRRKYIKEGQITALYCIWYGVGRLFLEGMRDPAYNLMLGNFKIAQIVSIGMIVFGIYLYIHRFRTTRFEYLYNEEELSKQA